MTEYRSFDDDVMKALFEEIAQEEIRKFDRGDEVKHRFSLRFRLKKRRLFRKMGLTARPKVRVRLNWRTAVCVIVMISLLTVSVGAAQGWFTRMEVISQDERSYLTEVVMPSDAPENITPAVPGVLPEGFSAVSENEGEDYFIQEFRNGDLPPITFFRFENNPDNKMWHGYNGDANEDFAFAGISEIQIGDYRGIVVVTRTYGFERTELSWSDGRYSYMLSTTTGYDEAIKELCESDPVPNTLDDLILIAESVR